MLWYNLWVKIIKPDKTQWQDKEGYSKKILYSKIDLDGVVFQQVKIKAGETAKSHHHKKQTEIFYFFNNNGYWVVNGERVEPKEGDILIIEPNDKHEVVNRSKSDYLYLAFKYNYEENDSYYE